MKKKKNAMQNVWPALYNEISPKYTFRRQSNTDAIPTNAIFIQLNLTIVFIIWCSTNTHIHNLKKNSRPLTIFL